MLRLSLLAVAFLLVAAPARAAFPTSGAADLRTQANVEIIGAQAGAFGASAVAPAGDFNGDGADDVLVASPIESTRNGSRSGAVYVIFGRRQGVKRRGPAGIRISGTRANEYVGPSIAPAGDFNGDGVDDIAIGSSRVRRRAGEAPRGAVHVVFGSRRPRTVRLADLGRGGLTLYGARAGDRFGAGVAGGRDVDGDGRPDVVAGAGVWSETALGGEGQRIDRTRNGVVVLRGGKRWGTARRPDLTVRGLVPISVGLVADMNGDRRAEILTGGGEPTNRPRDLGRVTFGRPATGATVAAAATPGFTITGNSGTFVTRVADGGDVNGDGRGDVLVSGLTSRYAPPPAPGNMAFQSGVTVVHGKPTPEPVDAFAPGAAGLALTMPDMHGMLGASLAPAGDLDGDGLDDVLVGAETLTARAREAAGSAYVLFGSRATGTAAFDTARSYRFDGEQRFDRFGRGVAGAGDFNADGRRDLVFGASNASRALRRYNGVAYVVYGR